MPHPVLLLARDLILGSRIAAHAEAANVPLRTLRDPALLAGTAGVRLLVDLNLSGAIEAAAAWRALDPARITIGFVSHVDAATIQRAKEQQIDRVLARSAFVRLLPGLLKDEYITESGSAVNE